MSYASLLIYSFIFIVTSSQALSLPNTNDKDSQEKRVSTMWSDKKDCSDKDAFLMMIQSYKNTYKVAGCSVYGCRISVREFGKKTYTGEFKDDSRFTWLSDKKFEAVINGNKNIFYHCITK